MGLRLLRTLQTMIHQTPKLYVNLADIRSARRIGDSIHLNVGDDWKPIVFNSMAASEADEFWKALEIYQSVEEINKSLLFDRLSHNAMTGSTPLAPSTVGGNLAIAVLKEVMNSFPDAVLEKAISFGAMLIRSGAAFGIFYPNMIKDEAHAKDVGQSIALVLTAQQQPARPAQPEPPQQKAKRPSATARTADGL